MAEIVAVLGEGSMGTTLATVAASAGDPSAPLLYFRGAYRHLEPA